MTARAAPLDFVVVGAQRAASTHLNACLRSHPQIAMCPDEVPFFEAPFFESSSPSELERVFAHAAPGQRRGIQRPDYLARPECPGNIHQLAPEARILAVLRDPVARAVSAYFWYVQFGLLPLAPLDDGMERLLDGWTDPRYPRSGEIIELGRYGRHLPHYSDIFGADHVLVLLNEDLRREDTFGALYRFLDVDPDHRPPASTRATNAGVHDLRRLRVLRSRRRFAWSWDGVSEYRFLPRRRRRPAASAVAAAIVVFDRVVLARAFRSPAPVLRPDLERRLRARYVDDVAFVEETLGRRLDHWRHPAPALG